MTVSACLVVYDVLQTSYVQNERLLLSCVASGDPYWAFELIPGTHLAFGLLRTLVPCLPERGYPPQT